MNGNGFEIIEKFKEYYTYYFIESHLKSIHSETELILDTSHKALKPLRKNIINILFIVGYSRSRKI